MGRLNSIDGRVIELVDSLGRRWPLKRVLETIDKKLARRFSLSFSGHDAQLSFETYCKKHFIEHGKHFDPSEVRMSNKLMPRQAVKTRKTIPATFDPEAVALAFESTALQISQGIAAIGPNLQNLDVQTLRELARQMNSVFKSYKDLERLELQLMHESDFEVILDEERDQNGARAALSVGQYFIESGPLTESKQLSVARWMAECAQDELDRILAAIYERCRIRIEAKVTPCGPEWSKTTLSLEEDRRWIPLTRTPMDLNVSIGMILGVLAGKGFGVQFATDECKLLTGPFDTVEISHGVVARAVTKQKALTKQQQILPGDGSDRGTLPLQDY